MVKPTPNPPGSEQSPPHQSSASEDLNEGDDLELDQNTFEFKSTPRTPCSMYTVNPDIDVQTLLGCVSESLASASVITMDLSLIHISEPTRPERISYAVFCLKKKKNQKSKT